LLIIYIYIMKKTLGIIIAFTIFMGITQIVQAEQAVVCPAGYICTKIETQSSPVTNTNRINSNELWTTASVTPPCYTFNSNRSEADFSNNSLGKEMLALQKYLISSGYKDVILSGRFDARTKAAVMLYQEKKGLPSTGYVGPLTRAILNASVCNNVVSTTTSSVVVPTSVPKITSVLPLSAKVGDTVTLYGSNFTGVTSDLISISNSVGSISPDTVYSITTNTVVFKMPNVPAGIYNVQLTANGGTSNRISLNALQQTADVIPTIAPKITSVLPVSAKPGDTVTLFGTNFTGVTKELISISNSSGSISPDTIYSSNASSVSFKMPSVPVGTYSVGLTSNNGTSNRISLNALQQAVQVATPFISSINPTVGKTGDLVTLGGTNFEGVVSDLLFMDTANGSISPQIVSSSATNITFRVPNVPVGVYKVWMLGDKGASNEVNFTVQNNLSTTGSGVTQTASVLNWFISLFR